MINYSLHENTFSNDAENYRAIVQSHGTLDLDQTIKEMIARGSAATEAGAAALLKDFFNTAQVLLLYGWRLSTPLFSIGLSIQGTFDDQLDTFDSSRHQIDLVFTPNRQFLRAIQSQAQTQKQKPNRPQPRPLQYINPNNGADNQTLTPGGGARVLGELLSFDQADPNQGIFLIAEDQSSTRIEVVINNTPSDLIFLVPSDLTAGQYQLEVRAQFGAGLRSGTLKNPLTVP